MGEVYKALDTRLNRTVAIKVSCEQFSERFEREARAMSSHCLRPRAVSGPFLKVAASGRASGPTAT